MFVPPLPDSREVPANVEGILYQAFGVRFVFIRH